MAAATGTTIVPVVLGVPFSDWPPTIVGQTQMTAQFKLPNGDLKIFVDMSDAGLFHTKLKRELLPRLKVTLESIGPTTSSRLADVNDPALSDVAHAGAGNPSLPCRRPQRPASNAVVPVELKHDDGAGHASFDTIPVLGAGEGPSAHRSTSGRGSCSECVKPVLSTQHRVANANGTYRHDPCK